MGRRGMLALLLLSARVAAAETPMLHYADGLLSARIDQVPLVEVLQALADQTGASIGGEILEPRDVTKHFDDLPIDRAVDRLLGRQNFTLRYGPDGRLTSIHLRGLPVAPATDGRKRTRAGRPPNLQRPVPLSAALQRALGRTHVPLSGLVDAAARQPDAAVRAAATRLMVGTIEADPELRKAIVDMDDRALAALLRARAGGRASEVAAGMMGAARSFELRTKAARMLQHLRSAPRTTARTG